MFKKKTLERREFLKGAAVAGGAVALGMAAGRAVAKTETVRESSQTPAEAAAKDKGYHVTQHIRDYYNSTRS